MTPLYEDSYGDRWRRVGELYVIRLRDGNIGGWFNGFNLRLKGEK